MVSIVHGSWADLTLAVAGLVALYRVLRIGEYRRLWRMVSRLRWFFIAIAIFYFWFTPGDSLFGRDNLPTWQGMEQGLLRLTVLVLIISAVHLLLRTTERNALIGAIYQMAMPLRLFMSPQRLAVRMLLTLEAVNSLPSLSNFSRKDRLRDRVAQVFISIRDRAETTPCTTVVLPDRSWPCWPQWLLPVLMVAVFAVLR